MTDRLPLTLIVPVFNRPDELNAALASIAGQSRLPECVIVVDDASQSPPVIAPDVVDKLRIETIRHETNRGPAAARNTGLRRASSTWVGFLDSDDYLLDSSLELRFGLIEEKQRAGADPLTVYGCGWVDFDAAGRPLAVRWPGPGTVPADFASGCWFSPGSCVFFDRERAIAAGLQDEKLTLFEDVDWFLQLALKGFTFEPLPLCAVAIRRNRSRRPEVVERAAAAMVAKWKEAGAPAALRRRVDAYMDLEIAAARWFSGRRAGAIAALFSSVLKVPRRSLQFSPGWETAPIEQMPGTTFARRDDASAAGASS